MKQAIFLLIILFGTSASVKLLAQRPINWADDTLSFSSVTEASKQYKKDIKKVNFNCTEQINLSVDKLKFLIDACAASGITSVGFLMVKISGSDLAHFKKHNPNASEAELVGSQMLVIKIPRRAFTGAAAAGVIYPSRLMLSMAAAGIYRLGLPLSDLPFGTGDYYFTVGNICPPPASCDTN